MNGSDQTLNVVIKAKDQASATLDKFRGKAESLGPSIKKMALVGVAAFTAIGAGAFKMFQTYAEAEAQTVVTNKSLENSFKNLSEKQLAGLEKAIGKGVEALGGLKEAAEKAGKAAVNLAFDDETAARSFAKLFSVTKDVGTANKELALAMDLARFKGISLEEATQKLIMVHSGSTKELKLMGIAIDENATAQQNLDSIYKQVGGTATEYGKTGAASMEKVKIQVENLKESIGEKLAPVFAAALTQISGLLDKVSAFDIKKTKEEVNKFLDDFDEKTLIVTSFKTSWDDVVRTFNETLIPSLQNLWETLKPLEPSLKIIGQIIGGALIGTIIAVTKAIDGWIQIFTALIALSVEVAAAIVKHFTEPIKDFIDNVKKAIEWVGKLINKVAGLGTKAVSGVSKILGFEHGGTVPGAIGTAVPIVAHGGETIIPAGKSSNGSGGVNLTLNMNYPQFTNSDSVDVVRGQIETALRDVIRIYKLQPTN